MPTAKKLPSGSWRCQVFSHFEEIFQADGSIKKKRIYKSFTVNDPSPKGRKLCEMMAAEWAMDKEKERSATTESMTVSKAAQRFFEIKQNVLSPSTLRSYKAFYRNWFSSIDDIKLYDLTSDVVQEWVNGLCAKLSPKSVSNAYGLLSSIMSIFAPSQTLHIRLPQRPVAAGYVPTDGDIQALIELAREKDPVMLRAICLAAFGTLRRSEVCAIDAKDVNRTNNMIHVHRAVVKDDAGELVLKKVPKNSSSDRFIEMPAYVIDMMPKAGRLVPYDPDYVSNTFKRYVKAAGLPHFRFHDLRHYAASIMHALGVPDVYIMRRGGWSSDSVMKRIYRGSISDYEKKFTAITNEHADKLMQHEVQHENTESA